MGYLPFLICQSLKLQMFWNFIAEILLKRLSGKSLPLEILQVFLLASFDNI